MYEFLKTLCIANGWYFKYARRDHQNLMKEADLLDVPMLFLDPVEISDNDNDSGETESITYSGQFMILVSSHLDEKDYDFRYQTYIKPIAMAAAKTIKDAIVCGPAYRFDAWRMIEVINVFDYNGDGVLISFTLTDTDL